MGDLISKTKTGQIAVVFTDDKNPKWVNFKNAIEDYEKQDSDVKFYVAPVDNQEFLELMILIGIRNVPTLVLLVDGNALLSIPGAPKSSQEFAVTMTKLKQQLTQIKLQIDLQKSSPPKEDKKDETIQFRHRMVYPKKVMLAQR